MKKQNTPELDQPVIDAEEIETHTEQDKSEFLEELESEFDPQAALDKADEKAEAVNAQQLALEATQETVLVGVGMADFAVKEMLDERLEIGEDLSLIHILNRIKSKLVVKKYHSVFIVLLCTRIICLMLIFFGVNHGTRPNHHFHHCCCGNGKERNGREVISLIPF